MVVERAAGRTSLVDVLDRIFDKGVVIDTLVRASSAAIDLITVEARVVVASIDTYLKDWALVGPATSPARQRSYDEIAAEDATQPARFEGATSPVVSPAPAPARRRTRQ